MKLRDNRGYVAVSMVPGSNGYAGSNASDQLIWIEFSSREVVKLSQSFLSLRFHLEVKLPLKKFAASYKNAFPWKVLEQRPKGYLSTATEQVQFIS